MKQIILLLAFFISFEAYSQSTGSVAVFKDPRIDLLLKKQADINNYSTRNSKKRRNVNGYRLLVISTNSRTEAVAARTKVLNYFPELKAYMWHQSPYYKVKAGNFTSRQDAQDYQKRLNNYFPNGVFIMNDIVEVKPGANDVDED